MSQSTWVFYRLYIKCNMMKLTRKKKHHIDFEYQLEGSKLEFLTTSNIWEYILQMVVSSCFGWCLRWGCLHIHWVLYAVGWVYFPVCVVSVVSSLIRSLSMSLIIPHARTDIFKDWNQLDPNILQKSTSAKDPTFTFAELIRSDRFE
jgi:hypothetical protein